MGAISVPVGAHTVVFNGSYSGYMPQLAARIHDAMTERNLGRMWVADIRAAVGEGLWWEDCNTDYSKHSRVQRLYATPLEVDGYVYRFGKQEKTHHYQKSAYVWREPGSLEQGNMGSGVAPPAGRPVDPMAQAAFVRMVAAMGTPENPGGMAIDPVANFEMGEMRRKQAAANADIQEWRRNVGESLLRIEVIARRCYYILDAAGLISDADRLEETVVGRRIGQKTKEEIDAEMRQMEKDGLL